MAPSMRRENYPWRKRNAFKDSKRKDDFNKRDYEITDNDTTGPLDYNPDSKNICEIHRIENCSICNLNDRSDDDLNSWT